MVIIAGQNMRIEQKYVAWAGRAPSVLPQAVFCMPSTQNIDVQSLKSLHTSVRVAVNAAKSTFHGLCMYYATAVVFSPLHAGRSLCTRILSNNES